jgi:methionyl aminopeptidase
VKLIKPGVHLGDIQAKVQEVNESYGYSMIRDYTGHGIGREMHEDPAIPNYGKPGTGIILKEGMTFCVEPMVAEGRSDTRVLGDGWTVKMKDGKLSCHYENTIAVTADGYEILTLDEGEK